jgi:ketosteroid isomerase-like protein
MGPQTNAPDGPAALVHRLCAATNAHDLEALVACFAPDYRNETPAHPDRGFSGAEQVRRNWSQIFAAIPDLTTEVVGVAVDGDTVWSEWEHHGTRPDGSAHLMRGVVIFGVTHGQAAWARFYLEPVQDGGRGVDDAVRRQVVPGPPR